MRSNPNSRRIQLLVGLGLLAALALVPTVFHFDLTFKYVAAQAVIYSFPILSLVLLTGYVGQISLCQGTFMGISAYSTAALVYNLHWDYAAAAACGVAVSFLLGVLVGLPALRLRGILLAIVTVGVALVFDYYVFQDKAFAWLTGGASGWTLYTSTFLGIKLSPITHILNVYYVVLVLLAITAVLVVNVHNSGSGRRFRAIRDSEVAASTMGVNLMRYKLLAFGISAAIAGVGGAFFPIAIGSVSGAQFSLLYSLQFAAFAVLMGIRFVPSAVIGGFFMAFVPALIDLANQHYGWSIRYDWFNLALGALLVLQIISAPDGVYGDITDRVRHLRERLSRGKPLPVAPAVEA